MKADHVIIADNLFAYRRAHKWPFVDIQGPFRGYMGARRHPFTNVGPSTPRRKSFTFLTQCVAGRLYRCDPWKDTTDGACQAFILYQRYPVLFFLDRFQGMTLPVAKFLANRVFCILDDPDDDSKRIDARSLGRWVGGLPYLLTRSRSGSKVDREGEVLLRNIALASQVLAREIRRASKYHTRRGVKILDFSLAS